MTLSERGIEIQLLDQAYADCLLGKGSVIMMNGPVGCGKTATLHALGAMVAQQGGRFISLNASASERSHPLGLITELTQLLRAAGMSADPFGCTAAPPGYGDPGPPPAQLLQAIWRAVRDFTEDRPLVIGIDDAHFADDASQRALGYLIRRIERTPVMIVANTTSGHGRQLAELHAETLHLHYCTEITLRLLSDKGVLAVLTERCGAEEAGRLAEACMDITGGSPLLLHALLDDHLSGPDLPDQPGGPDGIEPAEAFRHAVQRSLHRCESTGLAIARAAAVLGDCSTPELIGELLRLNPTRVAHGLADLAAAALLRDARFRHEQARQAVLAEVPLEDLPGLHGRAAELLHDSATPITVAGHLMAAQDTAVSAWRAAVLREAAREVLTAGEAHEAVGYLRYASEIAATPTQAAQITADLAETQWLLDPVKGSRYLHSLVQSVRAGVLTGEEALVPVRQLLWRGDFTRADELLTILEDAARADGADQAVIPGSTSWLTTARLWMTLCFPGTAGVAADGQAPRRSGQAAEPVDAAAALALLAAPLGLPPAGTDVGLAERVLHGTHLGGWLVAPLLALVVLVQAGHIDEADRWTQRLLGEASIGRIPVRRALLETIGSLVALRRGAPQRAARHIRSAFELVAPSAWGVVAGLPLAVGILGTTESGDFPQARQYVNQKVPASMFGTWFALPFLHATGRYHLAVGNPQAARAVLLYCGELAGQCQFDSPDVADWRSDAAAALTAMGRTRQARKLIGEQISRAGDHAPRARALALRRLAAVSHMRLRPALLQEAAQLLEATGDRLELSHIRAELVAALEVLGAATAAGQPGAAPSEWLPPGPDAPADDRGESGSANELARVFASLTDAERRVATLAMAGRTNRQVADELFITVSTVEQHLTKIYRKLNVRRRADLSEGLLRYGNDRIPRSDQAGGRN